MANNRIIVETNGRQWSADSFDRFGDDLCEVLLSYLSFEDKIRLQCVDKQWNRLVFNKQTALIVSDWGNGLDYINKLRRDCYQWKSLLKKCPNIKKIIIHSLDDSLLDIITECCPRLESIEFLDNDITPEVITRFGQRLGHRLKSIVFYESIVSDIITHK